MNALRQAGSGVIIGAVSLILVIGGISLALSETSAPSFQPTPSPVPTQFAVEFASPFPTPDVPTIIPTDTPLNAILPQPTVCTIPGGWIAITVGANEDLNTIAQRYNITTDELNSRNCLNFQNPAPGTTIYVPAVPTKVVAQCFPPGGWVKRHVVQPGENLFRIALSYGISYPQLQAGNCLGSSTTIFAGQLLWVPNVPTITPAVTSTKAATTTPSSTSTKTPDFSTITPSSTFMATSSPVPATATPTTTPSTPNAQ
ncbi:MAG TPA: hypothetical protein DCX53_01940 [Anaerolineae bacterium]|nr:hypothetical protein [Anaerolineae bacterium]